MTNKIQYLLLVFLAIIVFHNLLTLHGIVGGDWPYLWSEWIQGTGVLPSVWNPFFNIGSLNVSPWIDGYLYLIQTIFVKKVGLPWEIVQLFFFFFLAIALSLFSSIYLFREITGRKSTLPAFFYLFNTYFLMIFGGGQIGICLSYAIAPFVLVRFIRLVQKRSSENVVLASLVLGIQMLFDTRLAYVTCFIIFFYWIYAAIFLKDARKSFSSIFYSFVFTFVMPGLLVLLLHSYWLLPSLFYRVNPKEVLGTAYSTTSAVRFFSFAHLEETLSLLHPYWPENIFGKVSFMKPEFIGIALLAFSSLLFIPKETERKKRLSIFFFVAVALIGVFLAKGANEPFGSLYLWLFQHVPGFFMFRDATKWYTLIALSYSVLIPLSLYALYDRLKGNSKYFSFLFLLFAFLYFIFLLRPALLGQLSGTFKRTAVPHEYIVLKDYLASQPIYFRTLWIPQRQRFGFYSLNHPAVDGELFFQVSSPAGVLASLRTPDAKKLLQEASVKYVIVPNDSLGELFLEDRKYSAKKYYDTIKDLQKIPWLTQEVTNGLEKIAIFSLAEQKDHFWSPTNQSLSWKRVGTNNYEIVAKNGTIDGLVFSEAFDPNWIARAEGTQYASERYHTYFTRFQILDATRVEVFYQPERLGRVGSMISGATLLSLFLYLILKRKKNHD